MIIGNSDGEAKIEGSVLNVTDLQEIVKKLLKLI